GNLSLTGGRILGGTLTSTGTARLVPNSSSSAGNNQLDGVQIAGNALDMSAGNAFVRLVNGTDFTAPAAITVGGQSALRVEEAVTLHNLTLNLGAGNYSSLQLYGGN